MEKKKRGVERDEPLPDTLYLKFILVAISHAGWYEQVGLQIITHSYFIGPLPGCSTDTDV